MPIRHLIPAALLLTLAAPASAAETVAVPAFKSIELNGGGKVVIRHGSTQRVTLISGSTDYTQVRVDTRRGKNDQLTIDACNRHCPRNYDLRIEIVTPDVSAVAIHGGGEIVVQPGFSRRSNVAAAVNGGGEIDLRALHSDSVAAAVHGGGSLLVSTDNLAAAIFGGGDIRYVGDPKKTIAINGGGTVHRIR
jgi:hypothetical protein